MREIHKTHVQRSNLEMMPDLILEALHRFVPSLPSTDYPNCHGSATWRRSRKGANKNKELMSAFATTL